MSSGLRKFSGVAFDDPSDAPVHHRQAGPIASHGLGSYYGALGMNKWEVNKRLKARGASPEQAALTKAGLDDYRRSK